MPARCWSVTGRVQGVWFRESTRKKAEPLGLVGSAVNLTDGSVEVRAWGDAAALDVLERWLAKGPRLARVDRVVEKTLGDDAQPPTSFVTG